MKCRHFTFVEVSPSGLAETAVPKSHGSRRGLPSAALRAKECSSAFKQELLE